MFEAQIGKGNSFDITPRYYCYLPKQERYIAPFGLDEEPFWYSTTEELNADLRKYYNTSRIRKIVTIGDIPIGGMFVCNYALWQKMRDGYARQLTNSTGELGVYSPEIYLDYEEVQLPKETITIKGNKADY